MLPSARAFDTARKGRITMKKLITMGLALIMALTLVGCGSFEVIDNEEIALADGTATGTTKQVTAKALSSKVGEVVEIPTMAEAKTGEKVYSNSKAYVDASNANEGYIFVKYTGGKKVKILVQIYLTTDNKYNHNLNNEGNLDTFAFTEGDGKYTVRIMENTTGNKYACVYACEVEVKLRNELLPFLYSNYALDYANAPETVKKAADLTKDAKTDIEKVAAVYDYVVKNVAYDKAFANDIVAGKVSGHVPTLDVTLSTKKGICFDYASLMGGMLRSQGVPVRLVKGYAGNAYHAWINVYVNGVGWVDKVIQFDGQNWTMMDPTFVSTSKNANAMAKFVGDGNNYTPQQIF